MRLITLRRRVWICSTNSGRNWLRSMSAKFYSCSSFVKGLIIVQQSRSLKKDFNSRLILFFCSTISENPFWGPSAFSRYSLEVIGSCSESTNYKVKSRTTHIKLGKYWANSSGSTSSFKPPDFTWIFLVRFITRDNYERAFSSIEPILL